MPAKKFLRLSAGRTVEVSGIVVSSGVANDGDVAVLDSTGRYDSSVMPLGLGADTVARTASEALSARDMVNIWDNAGSPAVRKADATVVGKEANGFVLGAVANAGSATIYFSRLITGLAGLTIGARYYLSTSPGLITTTPPSAAGNVVQFVGRAISATELAFEPEDAITVA